MEAGEVGFVGCVILVYGERGSAVEPTVVTQKKRPGECELELPSLRWSGDGQKREIAKRVGTGDQS